MNLIKPSLTALFLFSASVNADVSSWNLSRDMTYGIATNPSAPWSYLEVTKGTYLKPTTLQTLPDYNKGNTFNGSVNAWGDAADPYLAVGVPTQTFTDNVNGAITFTAGKTVVNPGIRPAVIKWTSPVTGTIDILGSLQSITSGCVSDGVKWVLRTDTKVLVNGGILQGQTKEILKSKLAVNQGDGLYLILDKNANSTCDWTSIDLMIVETPKSHWQLSKDYAASKANPSDVWSFMGNIKGTQDPTNYELLTMHTSPCLYDEASMSRLNNMECWKKPNQFYGLIGYVFAPAATSPAPITPLPVGSIVMHTANNYQVIAKWQGTFSGKINISGFINKLQIAYDSNWLLMKGTTVLATGGYNWTNGTQPFTATGIDVTPSDSIYFVYDPGSQLAANGMNIDGDGAGFDITIDRIQ